MATRKVFITTGDGGHARPARPGEFQTYQRNRASDQVDPVVAEFISNFIKTYAAIKAAKKPHRRLP